MKTIKELKNNKFKIFRDGLIWEIIEKNPEIYPNCIRAKAGKITSPFKNDLLVYEI